MARTTRTYTVTRNIEGRILTTYSDGSYVMDWSPDPRFDAPWDHFSS